MTTFTFYEQAGPMLTIYLPISEELIRDALDGGAVADLAAELAAQSARDAVLKQRKAFLDEGKTPQ